MLTQASSEDVPRSMRKPVVDIERGARGLEIPVVKGQKVLVMVVETLQGVGFSFRKIPDIARVEDLVLVTSEFVNSRDCDTSIGNISPFSL